MSAWNQLLPGNITSSLVEEDERSWRDIVSSLKDLESGDEVVDPSKIGRAIKVVNCHIQMKYELNVDKGHYSYFVLRSRVLFT